MDRQRAGKAKENAETSSGKGTEDVQCSSTSGFGEYSNEEMIAQLRGLAIDPRMRRFAQDNNIQSLCDQILRLRKFMVLEKSEMPWRKRKFEQFVKDKLPKPQNETKRSRRRSQTSSSSYLLNSVDSAQNDVVDSDESLNPSTPNQSQHFGISDVDNLQRKAVPFGPRFQADVPEWDDSALIGAYNSDPDNSKWLGSRVWPSEIGNVKSTGRRVGKGRSNSCSCTSQGSADCIKCHILDERLCLHHELGPAFARWKFDEMGEQVSESWSSKEQRAFELLMKKSKSSDGKSFWIRFLKAFPRKSRKDIVGYYFNVYIAHRMSTKQVDTDDEEEDEARAEKEKYLRSS